MPITPQTTTYQADRLTIAFGPVPIDGFADGEFLTIEQNSDDWLEYVGSDGKVCRAKSNNKTATVKIIVGQYSAANDALTAFSALGKTAPNGADIQPFFVRDRSGRSLYASADSWIKAPPKVSFGREVGTREWTIYCSELERVDGGN